MRGSASLLETIGGEAGARILSGNFYARVGQDSTLRPLFPGKSLRCAIEEFAAFLIQFLGGDETQSQDRWWLSLRESHARFHISPAQRAAWLKHMFATLADASLPESTQAALRQFFLESSAYVTHPTLDAATPLAHPELATRWAEQRALDDTISLILDARDAEAILLAARFRPRPSVFVGLLARMLQTARPTLLDFVLLSLRNDPSLAACRHAGKALLHYAAGAGSLEAVALLLELGSVPDLLDRGGHTPLYCLANECSSPQGPALVHLLIGAGAEVNAAGGVTRATPLHMAARRGSVGIAAALLDSGASLHALDRKGDTPLQRARNCRKPAVALLLEQRAAQLVLPPRDARLIRRNQQ